MPRDKAQVEFDLLWYFPRKEKKKKKKKKGETQKEFQSIIAENPNQKPPNRKFSSFPCVLVCFLKVILEKKKLQIIHKQVDQDNNNNKKIGREQ